MRLAELLLTNLGEHAGSSRQSPILPYLWNRMASEAVRHGLTPLLYQRVRNLPPKLAPPPSVVERLRDLYVHSELRNACVFAELARVLRVLREAGVEVIVLKGAFLAEAVYGDAALRPMHDVDLLVRRSELDRARTLLEAQGYALTANAIRHPQHHLPPLTRPGALPIEVHWTTVRPSSISPDLEHLWKTAREVEVAGVRVLTLSPEHLLHHLCLHVSYHHRFQIPLLQVHDIAAVLRHYRYLEWEAFEEMVRLHGSARFVFPALALTERAFPGSVSPTVLDCFRGSEGEELVLETAWECLTGPPSQRFPRLYLQLEELGSAGARAEHLARRLPQLVEHFRLKYNLPHGSLRVYGYLLAHALRFLRNQGRLAGEILLRASTRGSLAAASRRASLDRWSEQGIESSSALDERSRGGPNSGARSFALQHPHPDLVPKL